MPDKKITKEMERAILARVKEEMALPRITRSAREALLAIRKNSKTESGYRHDVARTEKSARARVLESLSTIGSNRHSATAT